jgi:hypothetical protein
MSSSSNKPSYIYLMEGLNPKYKCFEFNLFVHFLYHQFTSPPPPSLPALTSPSPFLSHSHEFSQSDLFRSFRSCELFCLSSPPSMNFPTLLPHPRSTRQNKTSIIILACGCFPKRKNKLMGLLVLRLC